MLRSRSSWRSHDPGMFSVFPFLYISLNVIYRCTESLRFICFFWVSAWRYIFNSLVHRYGQRRIESFAEWLMEARKLALCFEGRGSKSFPFVAFLYSTHCTYMVILQWLKLNVKETDRIILFIFSSVLLRLPTSQCLFSGFWLRSGTNQGGILRSQQQFTLHISSPDIHYIIGQQCQTKKGRLRSSSWGKKCSRQPFFVWICF